MDELAVLGEGEAVRLHADGRNSRFLLRLLWFFGAMAAIATLISLVEELYVRMGVAIANLVLVRFLLWARHRDFFSRSFRTLLVGYLTVQLLLVWGLYVQRDVFLHPLNFLLPLVLLVFRLPAGQAAVPVTVFWAVTVGRNLLAAALGRAELSLGLLIGVTLIALVVLSLVGRWSRAMQREFLAVWRRENHRYRERTRMRGELDDARRIQLSMLPRSDPRLSWLEVAGISIPASEVGGDYYDYFRLSETRQAIVVGDVAGHGVASGLLLSGVRSCLYLLKDEPLSPADVLRKLDRMVRQTTGKRSFVTLLYALFEQGTMSLTFSAAAHPPLLRYRARDGVVEELALYALPLGTGIPSSLEERTVEFESEDIFLLYTDGIAETTNGRGDLYGTERLAQRLADTAHDAPAREIRDTLLGDVWAFKGDGLQSDDITLVVVKAR